MKYENGKLDRVFTALANKYRRDIVYRLSLQPSSIAYLAHEIKLSLPAIHKHIRVLEKAQLLQRRKSGRSNFLALNRKGLIVHLKWAEQFNVQWGSDKESLENYIQRIERENSRK